MRWVFLCLLSLLALPVVAQPGGAMGAVGVQVGAEDLVPVSTTPTVPPPPPFTIVSETATLNESEGFARDNALTLAARQALPKAIVQLNPAIEMVKAEEAAKSVGDPMQFVKSYKIAKEILVPKYQITVDLVFDEKKLKSNFGHLIVVKTERSLVIGGQVAPAMPVGDIEEGLDEGLVVNGTSTTTPEVGGLQQIIYLRASSAVAQDKFFSALEKAGMAPVWQSLRRDGGVLGVTTPGNLDDLADKLQKMGYGATVANSTVEVTL